ncbi:longitudinals lacking protein, isoforms F/I/K/T-like [Rhodnius prolixus]|uniref:longitudinals lacking protein, isoforms F/I/K/T-like n=1 Tax=Rhodnius prolixus TaxID=13249 RepID=UPI003D187BE0
MEAVPCEQVRQRFYCPRCPKVYKYKVNLSRHLNYECGNRPMMFPMFTCRKCFKSYKYKDNLKRHQKYECGVEPQFWCPHCPYKANFKFSLKSHIILKHTKKVVESSAANNQ